jgi:hypothetical protein
MSEEVLALVIVLSILTFLFTLVRSSQQYRLKKLEHQSGGKSDESLTTSELQQMIQDAVAEANVPLNDELESVVQRLDKIDRGGRLVIDDEDPLREKTVGRPVRQRQR